MFYFIYYNSLVRHRNYVQNMFCNLKTSHSENYSGIFHSTNYTSLNFTFENKWFTPIITITIKYGKAKREIANKTVLTAMCYTVVLFENDY